MKNTTFVIALSCLLFSLSCAPPAEDYCGMSGQLPDLASGQASYKLNGSAKNATGSYHLDFPTDIVVGSMTLNIDRDEQGQKVQQLIAAGSFPICVRLDASDDGAGYALVELDGASYSTSTSQGGHLSILAQDGGELFGRFAFAAQQNSGSAMINVSDGAFRLSAR